MPQQLGLRRQTVRLCDHQRQWADAFEALATELRSLIGELVLEIEHVGSTAVEDLVAKPILDVAVSVESVAVVPDLVNALTPHAFIYRGDGGQDGGYLFVQECSSDVRVAHVHVVQRDDPQWRNYLSFRDQLRASADLRARYAALKSRLADQFPDDRRRYTAGKADFIRSCLATGSSATGVLQS